MHRHPPHYKGQTWSIDIPVVIEGKYNPYELDENDVYIVCNCGDDLFVIYISDYPEVKCQCCSCNETHLIYDVSHYPAASGYDPDRGKFRKRISPEGDDCFQVIASWLYPEESEDDDEDNDLDWFCLVARKTGTDRYYEVVNDETA